MEPGSAVGFEDALLVKQVQSGEWHVFARLVGKYQDRVYNTCWRICGHAEDAADLTQDAFLKALESIDRFRGKSAFYTWIFRIAVNLAISHQRKRRRQAHLSLGHGQRDGESLAPPEPADPRAVSPADALMAEESQARLIDALGTLDADYRAALVLRDVEGFDYQRIADILDVPLGTVKSRICRARTALRDELNRRDEIPAP